MSVSLLHKTTVGNLVCIVIPALAAILFGVGVSCMNSVIGFPVIVDFLATVTVIVAVILGIEIAFKKNVDGTLRNKFFSELTLFLFLLAFCVFFTYLFV